jgi:putative tryptophan/tyrosine transport system substrate-binding protein
MKRRNLVLLAGAAVLASPVVRAQQGERTRRVGYLTPATGSPEDLLGVRETRAFIEGLRELGWFDGRNIAVEHRFSGSGRNRTRNNAKELVSLNPDVIVSVGGPSLAALLAETHTIPIIFANVPDPVAGDFVDSLAQPGGNATGIGISETSLAGKYLQLLKDIAPAATRVMVLMEADSPSQEVLANAVARASVSLNIPLVTTSVREVADYERQIANFARTPGGGLIVLTNPIVLVNHEHIQNLVAHHRLPAVYTIPNFASTGALVAYGADPVSLLHDAAAYVDKVLRGARPSELPVQQPTRFFLAVNLTTAKTLGLTVPPSILAQADEVIE